MNTVPASSGIITDIQRFSLNDGPGIRTTVILLIGNGFSCGLIYSTLRG